MPRRSFQDENGKRSKNIKQDLGGDLKNTRWRASNNKIDDDEDTSQVYDSPIVLDKINIGIIEELVNDGDIKSSEIATKLKIPLSTIQRRRSNLEKHSIIKRNYSVDLKSLHLRIAEIMVEAHNGDSDKIMNEIYGKHKNNIIDMALRIGNPDVNLSFRIAYRNSIELFEILEQTKKIEKVDDVSWSEYISEKKNNKSSFADLLIRT